VTDYRIEWRREKGSESATPSVVLVPEGTEPSADLVGLIFWRGLRRPVADIRRSRSGKWRFHMRKFRESVVAGYWEEVHDLDDRGVCVKNIVRSPGKLLDFIVSRLPFRPEEAIACERSDEADRYLLNMDEVPSDILSERTRPSLRVVPRKRNAS
jgi:hypothetical protein